MSATDRSHSHAPAKPISRRERTKDDVIVSLLPQGRLSIFEASAGKGVLATRLHEAGHNVTVSNFMLVGGLPFEECRIDLNQSEIAIPNAPFDAIICREVIEHVENIPHPLRVLGAHLKPGGTLILTLPNRLCLRSRLYHLFTGFYRGLPSPINLKHPLGEEHINLVGFPELAYFLEKTGFTVTRATSSEKMWLDHLTLFLRPLFWLSTRYFLLHHKTKREGHELETPDDRTRNAWVCDTLVSTDLFIGKDLIVAATKNERVQGESMMTIGHKERCL